MRAGEQHGERSAIGARHRRRRGETVARREPAQCRVRSGREQRAGALQAERRPRTRRRSARAAARRRRPPPQSRASRLRRPPTRRRSRCPCARAAARPRRRAGCAHRAAARRSRAAARRASNERSAPGSGVSSDPLRRSPCAARAGPRRNLRRRARSRWARLRRDRPGTRISSPSRLGEQARLAIDAREHDPLRHGEIAHRIRRRRRLHELDPDRQRGARAGLAPAEEAALVVADPHAGDDVRREAHEPGVGLLVRRAGLAGERPAELARARAGAVRVHDRGAQQIGREVGLLGREPGRHRVGRRAGATHVDGRRRAASRAPAPPVRAAPRAAAHRRARRSRAARCPSHRARGG